MSKMNCDIIKDLIPSYMDEICSEATRECVEEHLKSCDKCRQIVSFYGSHTLSGEKTEQQSVEGLKKIKKLLNFRNRSYYFILAAIFFFLFWMYTVKAFSLFSDSILFLLFLVCILATIFYGFQQKGNTPLGIVEYLMGASSLVIDIYFVLAFVYLMGLLAADEKTVFGMPIYLVGPFLEKQILAAFILQGIFFVHNLSEIVNHGKRCGWLLCLNVSGAFLLLRFDHLMYMMDNRETLLKVIRNICLSTAIVALLGIAASLILGRFCREQK